MRPAALAVSRPPVQQQPKKKKREPIRKPLSWGASIDARKCSLDGVRAFARPFPVGAPWSKAEAIIEAVRLVEAGDPPLMPNPEEESTHFSMPTREDLKRLRDKGHRLI